MQLREKTNRTTLMIVHPGTQHAYQLANGAVLSGKFSHVDLYTGFITRRVFVGALRFISTRRREILHQVRIHNYFVLEVLRLAAKKIFKLIGCDSNDPDYLHAILLNCLLLPMLFRKKNHCLLVVYDGCGWPIIAFARRWKVPVLLDFPAVSHQEAARYGISESALGIHIKSSEMAYADYAFFCSKIAERTYKGMNNLKNSFIHYPGTVSRATRPRIPVSGRLQMCFIGNRAFRKGLDIVLSALKNLSPGYELVIIGDIPHSWVNNYCRSKGISTAGIFSTGKMRKDEIASLLRKRGVQLNLLPSRADAFGLVVPETMQLGIVNILSKNVGAGETLRANKNVFIMDDLTPASLASTINVYAGLNLTAKQAVHRNAFKASRNISWTRYYAAVAQTFSRILLDIKSAAV